MGRDRIDSGSGNAEEAEPLARHDSTSETADSRRSIDHASITSASTMSLILEGLGQVPLVPNKPRNEFEYRDNEDDVDLELPVFMGSSRSHSMTKNLRRFIWIVAVVAVAGWAFALVLFLLGGRYKEPSSVAYDHETQKLGSGRKVTLDQVLHGEWRAKYQRFSWIDGPNGEDGLLLEREQTGKDFLIVEDVRSRKSDTSASASRTLMKSGWFQVDGQNIWPDDVWPSPNQKKILIVSKTEKNWRHSFTGNYWIFDVATQSAEPLDPGNPDVRIQLASWSTTGDSVVFTRENNLYLRILSSTAVRKITKDGGPEYFYGVPDWVYEEEVFQGNTATWCSRDGQYVAFLRTNETMVPEYPVQYFLSRPSGKRPAPGEENYPEVRQIKYPKAGAPNPVVDLLFYDVTRDEVFEVDIKGGFADNDRLITEVLWANSGEVLIKESNRESDLVRLLLVDVSARSGKVLYTQDVAALDGGWVEPAQTTQFIPADPANGRPDDGYVASIIYKNNDHLAYFSPLSNSTPVMLTSGDWEVTSDPPAIDLKNNLVYFRAAKESPIQRHLYSVKLDGTDLKPIVDVSKPGYYGASFSAKAGYVVLSYTGPSIPWQKVMSTPSNPEYYEEIIEENEPLAEMAASHELPHKVYSTVTVDNFTLQVVERRPPFFDEGKEYPVLFYLYGGPGSQQVDRQFTVDFQSYVASSLGYIVVTVDGRGTGFIGRNARTIIRGDIGHYEALDQIATAKIWAAKDYVDETRMAIWGWSYGGFMTLKTLEADAGETFRYGMAVAPVTDWRFYDSVYTERYMHTPQHNPEGYQSSAITNATALSQNVRWLMMHGVADDNVHMQNTLSLIDKLDLAGIENYDVHFFPDSDHSIYFHNANWIVYEKLSKWLVNAFNGEWYKTEDPVPTPMKKGRV